MEEDEDGQDRRFVPAWTEEPYIEGGVYLPTNDRSPHPEAVPQRILDIAQATYGGIHEINPPPSPPPSPLSWIPRRYGGGFRFGRSEDNDCVEIHHEIVIQPLTEFHLFPKLPIELRRMIWRHCLPGPRLVELLYDEDIGACTSSAPLPTCLWICSESRKEVKLFYRLLFATDRAEATIYLDPRIDEVYLGIGNFHPGPRSVLDLFLSLDPKDIGQIENLAIDSDIANYHESDEEAPLWGLWWTLAMTTTDKYVFTNLQTLTIHRSPSHKSCNDSSYIDFHGDFILTELDSNLGEFQAWEMKTSGSYWKRKTKVRSILWELPQHNKATWEVPFSYLWADLEKHKYEIPSMALKTVRFVTFGKGPDHWAGRLQFLMGKKYVQASGCIYDSRWDLDTLLNWKEADTDGSGW